MANSGTYSDPDGDPVSITKVSGPGTVSQDASGPDTWSWSHTADDDTVQSGPISVTIRASDGSRFSQTSFTFTVNNAAASATGISAPVSVVEGRAFSISLSGATDPSSVDRATLQYGFDCGSGTFAFTSTNNRRRGSVPARSR